MSFLVNVSPNAQNILDKLPKEISLRIINKLELIKENPVRYLQHFEGDYYNLRIGDYRVLMDIDFKRRVIFVRVIDKRGRVYK